MLKRSLRLIGTLAIIATIAMTSRVVRASGGASANGTFTSTVQFCKYSVTVPAGNIDITETMPLGSIDLNDPAVELQDAGGGYIADNDDGGTDGYNSHLKVNVAAGTYIIMASTNAYLYDGTYPEYDSYYLGSFTLTVNSTVNSFSFISCGPGSNQGVTWFNPGDGRIDGQPGDRVVVWCNKSPDEIVVYGVGDSTNNSKGFLLGVFSNTDLLAAGGKGITKNAGLGNGTISAMQDGKGDFYVAWNGGSFKATGVGIFSKTFSCLQ